MIFLFVLFLSLLIFSRCPNSRLGLFFFILLLSVVIGFRGSNVGADTGSYISMYKYLGEGGYHGYPEPLFGYMNVLFWRCGFSFQLFQFVLSFTMLSFIAKVVRTNTSYSLYAIFVLYGCYFIFYTMNITRQMFAASLILYGYHFLYRRKPWRFILCVLLAAGFHLMSILALTALFIRKINFNTPRTLLFLIGSLILGLLLPDSFLMDLAGKYGHYLADSAGFREPQRLYLSVLLTLFWSSLAAWVYWRAVPQMRNNLWFKLYFAAVILNNLLLRTELGLRCVLLFSIAEIIVFPLFVYAGPRPRRRLDALIVNSYITIFFGVFLGTNSANILPYTNTLFP